MPTSLIVAVLEAAFGGEDAPLQEVAIGLPAGGFWIIVTQGVGEGAFGRTAGSRCRR
jgi:hypothetical protein